MAAEGDTMPLVHLTARDLDVLEQAARSNADARQTSRVLAVLDLADGQTPDQVAARYRVGDGVAGEFSDLSAVQAAWLNVRLLVAATPAD